MKKLFIGLLALGSISAHADCLSDVRTKILHVEEISEYHLKLSRNIDDAHAYKAYDTYSDLKKANEKLWEKVEQIAAQVCASEI